MTRWRGEIGSRPRGLAGGVAEDVLDNAVLARVIAQHRAPALRGEQIQSLGERTFEHGELVVDFDADRLKGLAGRVSGVAASCGGNGIAHDLGQLTRRGDRAGGDDRTGDATGVALVAVALEDPCEGPFVGGVDEIGGRATLAAIHSHVERPVVAEAETSVGEVELRRTHAEVEQCTRQSFGAERLHRCSETVEASVADRDPIAVCSESSAGGGQGHLVTIETEDRDAAVCCQQCSGMAGSAERGVDDDAVRHLGENLDDLVTHDRHVGESGRIVVRSASCRWGVVFGHCNDPPVVPVTSAVCSLPIRGARRDVSPVVLMASGRSTGLPFADRKTADGRDRWGCGSGPFVSSWMWGKIRCRRRASAEAVTSFDRRGQRLGTSGTELVPTLR